MDRLSLVSQYYHCTRLSIVIDTKHQYQDGIVIIPHNLFTNNLFTFHLFGQKQYRGSVQDSIEKGFA